MYVNLLSISKVFHHGSNQLTRIITVSSGYTMARMNPRFSSALRSLCSNLYDLVNKAFGKENITGFTEEETRLVLHRINNTIISTDDVKKLAGTNPHLLSLLKR